MHIDDGAGPESVPAATLDEARVVAVGHEADVLALALSRIVEPRLACEFANLRLRQFPKWEKHMLKRVLRQMEEDIALVLLGIKPAFQQIATRFFVVGAPGVMPSRHVVEIQLAAALLQGVEFHVSVAVDAGVGRSAAEVLLAEAVDHLASEKPLVVEDEVVHPQAESNLSRVFDIARGAAGALAHDARVRIASVDSACRPFEVVVAEELAGGARGLVALTAQQEGGDGAVDAAAHCDKNAFPTHCATPPQGLCGSPRLRG